MRRRGCNSFGLQHEGGCFHIATCRTAAAHPATAEEERNPQRSIALRIYTVHTENRGLFFSPRLDERNKAKMCGRLAVTNAAAFGGLILGSDSTKHCKRRRGKPRRLLQIRVLFTDYTVLAFHQNVCRFRPFSGWPAIRHFFPLLQGNLKGSAFESGRKRGQGEGAEPIPPLLQSSLRC